MSLGPRITVYLVSHNYGRYLDAAIESVLNQTVNDWELLLIDDGSSDHTPTVMKRYENLPNVKIFRTKGIGLTSVCNFALKQASGKYLIRLDGDDYFDDNILLILANLLDNDANLALVFPDYYLMDAEGEVFAHERRLQLSLEDHVMDMPPNGACTMFRISCLKQVGGYREDLGAQDGFDMWMKLKDKFSSSNVNLPLFYYRRHGENLTEQSLRIVNARRVLKKEHSQKLYHMKQPVLAIIPCRKHFDFVEDVWKQEFDGKTLLERDICVCLETNLVEKVVVTCDNPEAEELVNSLNNPRVFYYPRTTKSTQINTNICSTLKEIFDVFDPNYSGVSIIRYVQTPFISKDTIEEAITSLIVSKAESSCSVEEVDEIIYKRNSHGLTRITQDPSKMLGNEKLFRDTQTCLAVLNSNVRTGSLRGIKMVGFMISAAEGFIINSKYALEVACNIVRKNIPNE